MGPVTEKDTECCQNNQFKVGLSCMQGYREGMEDAHTYILSLPDDPGTAFFGVYDGHDGPEVAQYAGDHLHNFILKRPEYNEGKMLEALKYGFLDADAAMLKEFADLKKKDPGSTAVTVLIKDGVLYCANGGDSRAVASVNGEAVALSKDHASYSLHFHRCFGDFGCKTEKNIMDAPDVKVEKITPEWEFIVLACDGIWDTLSNEEVVEFVRFRIKFGMSPEAICEDLITNSLIKGSLDNMSVIIIFCLHNRPYSELVDKCALPRQSTGSLIKDSDSPIKTGELGEDKVDKEAETRPFKSPKISVDSQMCGVSPDTSEHTDEKMEKRKIKRPKLSIDSQLCETSGRSVQVMEQSECLFETTLLSEFFVDHTEFITTFLDFVDKNPDKNCPFVTGPSGFGKSTIVSMLANFFGIRPDEYKKNYKDTSNYTLFNKPYANDRPLNIMTSKYETYVHDHMAKYPVLNINLGDLCVKDVDELYREILQVMHAAAAEFNYTLDERSDLSVLRIIRKDFTNLDVEGLESLATSSGLYLMKHLHKFFNSKCIVLIDGIDSLAENLFSLSVADKDVGGMAEVFNNFISLTLKSNEYLYAGFLTGRIPVATAYCRGVSNIQRKEELAKSLGLSEEQVHDLFDRCQRNGKVIKFDFETLKANFGGYTTVNFFSTASVIESFKRGEIIKGWRSSSKEKTLIPVFGLDHFGKEMVDFFTGSALGYEVDGLPQNEVDFSLLLFLKSCLKHVHSGSFEPCKKQYVEAFKRYLYESGYFIITESRFSFISLDVRNKETKRALLGLIETNLDIECNLELCQVEAFIDAVKKLDERDENAQNFIDSLQSLFAGSICHKKEVTLERHIESIFWIKLLSEFEDADVKTKVGCIPIENTLVCVQLRCNSFRGRRVRHVEDRRYVRIFGKYGNLQKKVVLGVNYDTKTQTFSARRIYYISPSDFDHRFKTFSPKLVVKMDS